MVERASKAYKCINPTRKMIRCKAKKKVEVCKRPGELGGVWPAQALCPRIEDLRGSCYPRNIAIINRCHQILSYRFYWNLYHIEVNKDADEQH